MRYILSFLAGAFVGAVVALLYAPTPGEELRSQIRTQLETELEKAEAERQRLQEQVTLRLDETVAAVRQLVEEAEPDEATPEEAV